VIVMDLCMPGLDGFEVTRRLKRSAGTSHIPIVACTGLTRSEGEGPAREAGCDDVVLKPYSPEALRDLLEDIVEGGTDA